MSPLSHDQILQIWTAATATDLCDSRPVLLGGVPKEVVATLPLLLSPGQQMLSDLHALNSVGALTDRTAPIVTWLANAVALTGLRPEAQAFRAVLKHCQASFSPNGGAEAVEGVSSKSWRDRQSGCFLSFGATYSHLCVPFSRLLRVIGFDYVEHSDLGESSGPSPATLEHIKHAGAVVVLFGPKSTNGGDAHLPHDRPVQEALLARGMQTPTLIIRHLDSRGTVELPAVLRGYPVQVSFDFWNSDSFLDNCHTIIATLLDFKERQGRVSSESSRFRCLRAWFRTHLSSENATREIEHEVQALRPCGMFHHSFDVEGNTGPTFPRPEDLKYRIVKRSGPRDSNVSIRFGRCTPFEIEYFVDVVPALEPGQALRYWRSFDAPNTYPLSGAELARRVTASDFSTDSFETLANATYVDIVYDMEEVTLALHFPPEVEIIGHNVGVIQCVTREECPAEAARCRSKVKLIQDGPGGAILELTVDKPLLNHSYYLLYVPA